jgi:glyoxylase-like metal-dependent hydrolase (beta-lactamase superfamily II)
MLEPFQITANSWCIDTGYLKPKYTAAYLLIDEQIALVDCGVNDSVEPILRQLQQIGIAPEQITALCLTHAHLDHSGGAGLLIDKLPNATVYAHKDTIRHLVNPENLEKGARMVYGDAFFNQTYGKIYPLDINRTQILDDNQSLSLGKKTMTAIYTPGHAWHHHAFYCEQESIIFAGDAFGLSFTTEENMNTPNLYLPSTPPSQFAPQEMIDSYHRIINIEADCVCVTHYGQVKDTKKALLILSDLIEKLVDLFINHHHLSDEDLSHRWVNLCIQQLSSLKMSNLQLWEKIMNAMQKEAQLNISGLRHWVNKNMLTTN